MRAESGSKIFNWATGVRFPGRTRLSGSGSGPFGTGDEGVLADRRQKSQKHTRTPTTTQHGVTFPFLSLGMIFVILYNQQIGRGYRKGKGKKKKKIRRLKN